MATNTYTCTSISNRTSNNLPMTVEGNKFTISGDSDTIGSVSSFVLNHYHTQTQNQLSARWGLSATITFGNGDTVTSDTQTYACGNGRMFTNTFTIDSADQAVVGEKIRTYGISSVTINIVTKPDNGGYLYWQATSSHSMTIEMTYTAYSGANPIISNVQLNWNTGMVNLYRYQYTDFSFAIALDPYVGGDNPTVTLSVGGTTYTNYVLTEDGAGRITGASFSDILAAGTTNNYTIRVTDAAGHTGELRSSFAATVYSKPTITTFAANRYLDSGGSVVISDLGTHVCLDITVPALAAMDIPMKNGTTIENTGEVLVEVTEVGSGYTETFSVANISKNAGYTTTNNTTIDTYQRYTSATYTYRLIVSDVLSTSETSVEVGSSTAIMNIEKTGIAIGKLCTEGTAQEPVFEVAMKTVCNMDYPVLLAGYDMNRASQYANITISDSSHFDPYYQPRITRVGPIVYLSGSVQTNSTITKSGDFVVSKLAFIPAWAEPENTVCCVQSGIDSGFMFNLMIEYDSVSQRYMIIIRHPTATYTIPQALVIYLDCSWIPWDAYLNNI